MARGIIAALVAILILGAVAGAAFQAGAAAAAAGAGGAAAAYPYLWPGFGFAFFPFFGLVFPFLFILLIFGAASAAFGGRRHGWDRSRMFEEWHRQAHERAPGRTDS